MKEDACEEDFDDDDFVGRHRHGFERKIYRIYKRCKKEKEGGGENGDKK
jgi:hypothetical protein